VRVLASRASELSSTARKRVLSVSAESEKRLSFLKDEMEVSRRQFKELCAYLSYEMDESRGETTATPFLFV